MRLTGRSEHERGPEQHHLAVVAIRERDEALEQLRRAASECDRLRDENARLRDALGDGGSSQERKEV